MTLLVFRQSMATPTQAPPCGRTVSRELPLGLAWDLTQAWAVNSTGLAWHVSNRKVLLRKIGTSENQGPSMIECAASMLGEGKVIWLDLWRQNSLFSWVKYKQTTAHNVSLWRSFGFDVSVWLRVDSRFVQRMVGVEAWTPVEYSLWRWQVSFCG